MSPSLTLSQLNLDKGTRPKEGTSIQGNWFAKRWPWSEVQGKGVQFYNYWDQKILNNWLKLDKFWLVIKTF